MKKIIFSILIFIPFLFSGCCISFIDDSCVIERKVPGPTKIKYEPCKRLDSPKKPERYGENPSFKKISFNDTVYYGLTKNESIDLIVNKINYKNYCEQLEVIIAFDLNATKHKKENLNE